MDNNNRFMKYIDADKLKKAIEDKGLDCSFALKMERLDTLALIDELQHEQPKELVVMAQSFLDVLSKTPYNNKPITDAQTIVKQLLVFLNNPKLYNPDALSQQDQPAKRGYKDCNGCEYNRPLKDQIGWQFRGCFGGDYKGKPIAEIELCPLKVTNQQEQPEVDLDDVVENYILENFGERWDGCVPVSCFELDLMAEHFYKLGLNARNEG